MELLSAVSFLADNLVAMHWVDLKNLFRLQCVSAVLVMQPMNPIEHVLIQMVLILGVNHTT